MADRLKSAQQSVSRLLGAPAKAARSARDSARSSSLVVYNQLPAPVSPCHQRCSQPVLPSAVRLSGRAVSASASKCLHQAMRKATSSLPVWQWHAVPAHEEGYQLVSCVAMACSARPEQCSAHIF